MLEESTGNFSATRNVYDWYQNQTHVILSVMIKNLRESDVKVRLIDDMLDVTCDMANGSVFKLHFKLLKNIVVTESSWCVTPSKLEIKLRKTDKRRWQSLEAIPESIRHIKRKLPGAIHQPSAMEPLAKKQTCDFPVEDGITTIQTADENAQSSTNAVTNSGPKNDWYQTSHHVFLTLSVHNLEPDKVQVCLDEKTLNIDYEDETGALYNLNVNLHGEIKPTECTYTLSDGKLEVKLVKDKPEKWPSLENTIATETETPLITQMASRDEDSSAQVPEESHTSMVESDSNVQEDGQVEEKEQQASVDESDKKKGSEMPSESNTDMPVDDIMKQVRKNVVSNNILDATIIVSNS